jgi:hypothetical protein
MEESSLLRGVFFGAEHLRAGWRLLIYCSTLVAALFAVLLAIALQPVRLSRVDPWELFVLWVLLPYAALLLAATLATFVVSRLEKSQMRAYWGLVPGRVTQRFGIGALIGFGLFASSIGLIALGRSYSFGVPALHGTQALAAAGAWVVGASLYAVAGSLALYGYPLATLRRSIGFMPAATVAALVFAFFHIVWYDATVLGFLAILSQGMFLSLTMRRGGNIAFTAGIYAGIVFAQDFVFSVADSGLLMPLHLRNSYHHPPNWLDGASAGPKASVMSLLVFACASLVLFLADRRRQPEPPQSVSPATFPSVR